MRVRFPPMVCIYLLFSLYTIHVHLYCHKSQKQFCKEHPCIILPDSLSHKSPLSSKDVFQKLRHSSNQVQILGHRREDRHEKSNEKLSARPKTPHGEKNKPRESLRLWASVAEQAVDVVMFKQMKEELSNFIRKQF